MRIWLLAAIFGVAAIPARAQVTTTNCTQSGLGVQCTSSTPQPYQPVPSVTPVDIMGILRSMPRRPQPQPDSQPREYPERQPEIGKVDLASFRPTARDFYIGCSLLLSDLEIDFPVRKGLPVPKSAAMCSAAANLAIHESGLMPKPCPPGGSEHPEREFAAAYVEKYEQLAQRLVSERDGYSTYLAIVSLKWPCP